MKMYSHAWTRATPYMGFVLVAAWTLCSPVIAQGQPGRGPDMQVLTRGPVHEAFAEASTMGALAGISISRRPPEPIMELPPGQRPVGADVEWIPGYWSWDDEWNDFIWVSGVWRDLPPGRQWVSGYWWTTSQGNSQWISGFWTGAAVTNVTYLPPPPAPLDMGPNSPPPSPGSLWSPGSWVWVEFRYLWQPGYWVEQQSDWVWTSANYRWTPRGHVYVPGYWDYDLLQRGVIFAPVYYEQPIYRRPNYQYAPSVVISLPAIVASLFLQTDSHHYYFGDYYDRRFEERGYHPWHSRPTTRYGTDPIFAQYRTRQLRNDPDWDRHIDEEYRHRREHVEARPPQTLALQINLINNRKSDVPDNQIIGRNLVDVVRSNSRTQTFTAVSDEERSRSNTRGRAIRDFQLEREKIETVSSDAGNARREREAGRPVRTNLPLSPVSARPGGSPNAKRTPPPEPAAARAPGREREREGQPLKSDVESAPTGRRAPETPVAVRPTGRGTQEKNAVWPSPADEIPTPQVAPKTTAPNAELRDPRRGARGRTPVGGNSKDKKPKKD